MSEKSPEHNKNPEIPKMVDNCDNCKKNYQITSKNAIVQTYDQQPECNHLTARCSHCDTVTRMYIADAVLEQAKLNGLTIVPYEGFADQNIYQEYLEVYGIQLPQTYELTPRLEETIRKFGASLMAIPDELFWDNIEAETERPYNNHWR